MARSWRDILHFQRFNAFSLYNQYDCALTQEPLPQLSETYLGVEKKIFKDLHQFYRFTPKVRPLRVGGMFSGLHLLLMPHTKFGKDWLSSFWGEDVNARCTLHDDGRQPIAIGHLSNSCDLKILHKIITFQLYVFHFLSCPCIDLAIFHCIKHPSNLKHLKIFLKRTCQSFINGQRCQSGCSIHHSVSTTRVWLIIAY